MLKPSKWMLAASAALLAQVMSAWAAVPSDTPLASGTTASVKPNVMFILDDSGSMNDEFMPDGVSGNTDKAGYRNHLCNTMYFNPATNYVVPKDSTGIMLHSASPATYAAACDNGYSSSACSTDLGTRYYWKYVGATANLAWPASGSNHCTLTADTTKTGICSDGSFVTNSPASCTAPKTLVWERITVTAASTDALNYANWYSYYRKRLMMMKAAGGRAFQALTNKYRVGFITINPNSPVSDSKFVPIRDFDATQKSDWYEALYAQTTNGYTPLREALSRVGRYYGGKGDGINDGMISGTDKPDPVQYSCQQNFAILTTDGYWNSNRGRDLAGNVPGSVSYDSDAFALDAYNEVGAKFYISPRPMYDGAIETRVTTDKENEYQVTSTGCTAVTVGSQLQERTAQLQQSTSTLTAQTSTLQKATGALQTCPKTLSSCTQPSDWTNTSSCTWDTSGGTQRSCRYNWGAFATATGTCTKTSTSYSNGTTWNTATGTDCRYTAWSTPTPVSSCATQAQSGSSPYTVLTARTCQTQVTTALHPVSTCTATTAPNASGETTQCSYASWSAWANNSSCVAVPKSTGPSYTVGLATECQTIGTTVATQKIQYRTYTSTTTGTFKAGLQQTSSTNWTPASPTVPAWTDVPGTSCTRVDQPTVPYSPLPARRRPVAGEAPLPTAPCTAWPCTTSTLGTGGSMRSLADVAQYYYVTDLRPTGTTGAGGIDVSQNNVPRAGNGDEDDKATWQHMTTFTLGLGLAGQLNFRSDYKTATTGDFASIRSGGLNWPVPTDNTTVPNDEPAKLDDLWHAAVNGRGLFFSASNPDSVVTSLNQALAGINNRVASAAAAATSTLEPVAGDNFAYIAKYVTGVWSGDLEAKTIALVNDPTTGVKAGDVVEPAVWNAATKLAAQTATSCDTRNIKLFRYGATDNLVDFKWNTNTCDSAGIPTGTAVTTLNTTEQAYFGAAQIAAMGQYPFMTDGSASTFDQRTNAAGAPLVNFLRGQRANEGFQAGSNTAFFRSRSGVLGDVVNAQPMYVRAPVRNYSDTGYLAFKGAQASRAPVVYLAANDGMLHAFNGAADGGNELWAFMPTFSLANLSRLADTDYPSNHRYFTDGSPISGDVYDTTATAWKTILVGGLNKGGKGYYALDITDPANPKGLWEFTHANLGYSYGNPIIGKLIDGTWVVFVTSGLNNADGNGYLFILDAMTGTLRYQIATGAGTAGNPSGLNKITGWVNENADINMTINHIYGVDLLGNVWRFDINNIFGPAGREAWLITTLKDASGNPQPITTKPIAALIGSNIHLYVGTGRYLGLEDLADTQTQTVYGFIDGLTLTDPSVALIPNVRTALTQQTWLMVGSGSSAVRGFPTCQAAPVGWYVDLTLPKERVNVDMRRALGSLFVASNIPEPSACNVGGYSMASTLDLNTGCTNTTTTTPPAGFASGGASAGQLGSYVQATLPDGTVVYMKVASKGAGTSGEALVVGVSIVMIDGKIYAVVQFSDGHTETIDPAIQDTPPAGRRLTWREIVPQ
ncbi:PilC/PilY family type IV pilus protein [Sulfurisoma sediminicola]|uniref:Type IV pilus assembly protein PilY1 n=1 Tax=Sulfurisoma sediminicola TaxID=1381557 RepID=A0A497XAK7_9PROT|nr:PilC/PilY family type IV pilus protein [Sulfurisoma sediminicola]RLJ63587.1 type IV pilus assembly protein PilY1 [Sulfurisoma sediminicola]